MVREESKHQIMWALGARQKNLLFTLRAIEVFKSEEE